MAEKIKKESIFDSFLIYGAVIGFVLGILFLMMYSNSIIENIMFMILIVGVTIIYFGMAGFLLEDKKYKNKEVIFGIISGLVLILFLVIIRYNLLKFISEPTLVIFNLLWYMLMFSPIYLSFGVFFHYYGKYILKSKLLIATFIICCFLLIGIFFNTKGLTTYKIQTEKFIEPFSSEPSHYEITYFRDTWVRYTHKHTEFKKEIEFGKPIYIDLKYQSDKFYWNYTRTQESEINMCNLKKEKCDNPESFYGIYDYEYIIDEIKKSKYYYAENIFGKDRKCFSSKLTEFCTEDNKVVYLSRSSVDSKYGIIGPGRLEIKILP